MSHNSDGVADFPVECPEGVYHKNKQHYTQYVFWFIYIYIYTYICIYIGISWKQVVIDASAIKQ